MGPIAASVSAPLDGVERLRQRVTASLAALLDPTFRDLGSSASSPPTMEAYREYLAGEDLFYVNPTAAIPHYVRAAALDSTFYVPLVKVAVLRGFAGDGRALDSLANILERHRDRITSFERANVRLNTAMAAFDTLGHLEAGRDALREAPRSQFAAYLYAASVRQSDLHAADSVLSSLDPEHGALRGRVYYYDYLGLTMHQEGAFERELALGRLARARYPGRIYVELVELRALAALGRIDEIEPRFSEILDKPRDLNRSAASLAAATIHELRTHGHESEAARLVPRVIAWSDARSAGVPIALPLSDQDDRTDVLIAAHRWDAVLARADSLLAIGPANLYALRTRGVALAMRGDRAGAERVAQIIDAQDQRLDFGMHRKALLFIAAALGDQAKAASLMNAMVFSLEGPDGTIVGELMRDNPAYQKRYGLPAHGNAQ